MFQKRPQASERPASFEAGLLAFGILAISLLGCGGPEPGSPPSADEELKQILGLASSSEIHRIALGGRGSEEHAVPSLIEAVPGDAVVFETVDHRVHTVSFVTDSLTATAREFLDTQAALSSLPLVTRGSTFLVLLDGAPAGSYPFVSEGHGGHALGRILVTSPEDSAQGVGG